eukprot:TRINITY_DN3058_c1_g1_i2.p1 TRINITY_DN3058_c1_g1~~TRINITY_DN3058_c1_g1_i2.p1  ORF type:complete len:654 (+),score=107.87 TRINITY_DN3058_c1_g1_i2:121-1962(+)
MFFSEVLKVDPAEQSQWESAATAAPSSPVPATATVPVEPSPAPAASDSGSQPQASAPPPVPADCLSMLSTQRVREAWLRWKQPEPPDSTPPPPDCPAAPRREPFVFDGAADGSAVAVSLGLQRKWSRPSMTIEQVQSLRERGTLRRIIVDRAHRVLFCSVPGASPPAVSQQLLGGSKGSRRRAASLSNQEVLNAATSGAFLKVMFVRNATDRLRNTFWSDIRGSCGLSGTVAECQRWYAAIVGDRRLSRSKALLDRRRVYRAVQLMRGLTLVMFLKHLMRYRSRHWPLDAYNSHWLPECHVCAMDVLGYDFVGQYEATQDSRLLLDLVGLEPSTRADGHAQPRYWLTSPTVQALADALSRAPLPAAPARAVPHESEEDDAPEPGPGSAAALAEVRAAYSGCVGSWTAASIASQQKLIQLWWVVHGLVLAAGVRRWWIDYGTLLYWGREQRLRVGDYDVDVSLDASEWGKVESQGEWLRGRGCKWRSTSYRHQGRKKAVVQCDWFDTSPYEGADLYGFAFNETHMHPPTREGCALGVANASLPCGVCPIPRAMHEPLLCGAKLHGRTVCIPRHSRRHLVRHYGTVAPGASCRKHCCVEDPNATYDGCKWPRRSR